MSDSRQKFYEALAKAQGEIEKAKKDTDNPFFKSKYADLSSVWEACRRQLSGNGLAVLQFPDFDAETKSVIVETILTHSSGFEKAFKTRVPVGKNDAQGVGSAITYARRYALMAAIGIAPDDDDGESAQGRGQWAEDAEKKAAEWGDKRAGEISGAMKKKKPDTMTQFKTHIDQLAEEGAIAVEEYWRREDVQAFWAKKADAARDDAQAYVEAAIEALLPTAEAAE